MDITEAVNDPIFCSNPLIIVPKAKLWQYPMPTVNEILQSIKHSVQKLDLKWDYHQLQLIPASDQISIFVIHHGIYRYKRLIFVVSLNRKQNGD